MKNVTKTLAAAIVLAACVTPVSSFAATSTTTSTTSSFADINLADSWATADIQKAKDLGVFVGDLHGNFNPKETITRQEMASVLVNMLKLDAATVTTSSFTDVSVQKDWGVKAIEAVNKAGIMTGDGDHIFRPNDPISREELATILVKISNVTVADGKGNLNLTDANSIQPWALKYVQTALQSNLMHGDNNHHFYPTHSAIREEVAIATINYFNYSTQTKTTDYTGTEASAYVQTQDFAVMQLSGVNGYNVGLQLTKTAADVQKIEVSLVKSDGTVLATNTSTTKLLSDFSTSSQLSTPFNVNGSFAGNDGYWTYGKWNGTASDIPAKAIIKVTDLKGNTYTVENNTLSGNPAVLATQDYTGSDALAFVQPQDFVVMQMSDVNGYNVGLQLTKTAADVQKIEVSLEKSDGTVLATNTSTAKLLSDFSTATQLSTPFNVNGTFAGNDGYWTYGTWNGTASDVPAKAVIKVTDLQGNTYTVENDTLSGNPAVLAPQDYTGSDALAYVQPQDFAVMQMSNVNGYNVGLQLTKTAADVQKIEVSLEKADGTVLATNTSTAKLLSDFSTATQLSTPFNVNGTFAGDDGYWTYGAWNGTASDVPVKAVIKITDLKGNTYTVENDTLSGDATVLAAQ